MNKTWEFSFAGCANPEHSVQKFISGVNRMSIGPEGGGRMEFRAEPVPQDNPTGVKVTVGKTDLTDEQTEEIADHFLWCEQRKAMDRWVFSFTHCARPEKAAEAFIKEVDGIGLRDEEGREVELAVIREEPLDPSCILVVNWDTDLPDEEADELVKPYLDAMARERGDVQWPTP